MMDVINFSNKRILIAGVGGIGLEAASVLSKLGAKLVLLDIDEINLATALSTLNGSGHLSYVCDFSKVAEIEEKINGVVKENGAFDGLVFCVGIDASRPFKMCKYDYMLKAMNINFFSFIELLRAITKKGNYNRCGLSVVGISSVGAYLGNPSQTAYTASKAAMNGAVRSIAKELYSKGVRINTIAPGTTDTKMFREAESALSDSDGFKSRLDRQYMGLCKPSDIANGILFLLSDMSKMISGSCLNIDGGKLTS